MSLRCRLVVPCESAGPRRLAPQEEDSAPSRRKTRRIRLRIGEPGALPSFIMACHSFQRLDRTHKGCANHNEALLPYLPSELIWIGSCPGKVGDWPTFSGHISANRMLLQIHNGLHALDQRKRFWRRN